MEIILAVGFLLLLAAPPVVTVRARRLAATDPRAAAARVAVAVLLVAAVQVVVGYRLTQVLSAFAGSEGPLGWRQVWAARRPVNLTVAAVPAVVLAGLLGAALLRGRTDRVRTLGLWGNLALVPAGVMGFYVAQALVP